MKCWEERDSRERFCLHSREAFLRRTSVVGPGVYATRRLPDLLSGYVDRILAKTRSPETSSALALRVSASQASHIFGTILSRREGQTTAVDDTHCASSLEERPFSPTPKWRASIFWPCQGDINAPDAARNRADLLTRCLRDKGSGGRRGKLVHHIGRAACCCLLATPCFGGQEIKSPPLCARFGWAGGFTTGQNWGRRGRHSRL